MCNVEGCGRPSRRSGLCSRHYARDRYAKIREGSWENRPIVPKVKGFNERLLSRVRLDENTGCLLFTGGAGSHGYGQININGKQRTAHTAVWINKNGPIPGGSIVRHKCRNRLCVNPDHLELGTSKENNFDDKLRDGTLLRGEQLPQSKLTVAAVIEIRKAERPLKELAQKFGVSMGTASMAKNGLTWKHVHEGQTS